METKIIGDCGKCGYPVSASYEGEGVTCPMCGTLNEAISQGIRIPTWLFAGSIGLFLGILTGPVVIATTVAGQKRLEREVRERVR